MLCHFDSGGGNDEGSRRGDVDAAGMIASGALLQYLYETQKIPLTHITRLIPYTGARYMLLDGATRRNLELTETMREKQKRGSLLWVLDKTSTSMGGRLLRRWIEKPLMDVYEINHRLDGVEELKGGKTYSVVPKEKLSPAKLNLAQQASPYPIINN